MSQNLFSAIMLLDITVKATLLLAVTVVGAFLLRKRSAATVHRWWVLGFVGCFAIPAIALIAPTWTLPILPESLLGTEMVSNDHFNVFTSQEALAVSSHLINMSSRLNAESQRETLGKLQAMPDAGVKSHAPPTKTLSSVSDPSQTSKSIKDGFSWTQALLTVWIGGVLVCFLRKAWQHVMLVRMLRCCTEIVSESWKESLAEASRSLGLKRTVSLLKLQESQSPLCAGLIRATVILPRDADHWDSERRRSVLLHELAHVKRYDVLTQAVAGFVCVLYWFNPICWVGLLQMRKLRELACDDLVLVCGQQPADYADVLLDVARSYRHRSYCTAVGMAHRANVENRILAILDKARSHVSLTRRAARILLVSATAMVLLIGSVRLQSKAEQPSSAGDVEATPANSQDETPPADAKIEETDADGNFRTMEVRITDEEGQPIEGAKLYIGVWYTKGYQGEKVPKEYFANSEGVVALKLPSRLRILRLWPSKPGYVPEFTNFGLGSHDEGELIPDQYEFQLAKGTKLSGTVVDENGKPVSGVTVDVSVEVSEPAWVRNPKSMISTGLTDDDFNEGPAITDKDGKWHINNAPAQAGKDDYKFRLKFTHKDYASDGQYGELQDQQHLSIASLRDGTAELVLSQGKPATGTVVDSAGNPVTHGSVVWRHDDFGDDKKYETKLDDAGRFETSPLPPGEHPFTVIAKGFLPERRMVTVTSTMMDIHFELKLGKRLTVKVVDPDGTPIPNAYFHVGSWPSVEPAFNGGQSSVFHSRIPGNADEDGLYSWDGAPEDAVTFRISASEFASKTVTLIATQRQHVVELSPSLVVYGEVTDTDSGKSIRSFRVFPVIVNRPKYLTTWYHGAETGENGQYEIRLDGFSDAQHYKIRLEADGYRSELSKNTYELSDGRVHEDFSLQPAMARRGLVLGETGDPVAMASVVQATLSNVPNMQNAELAGGWSGRRITTSGNGEFRLAAISEPVRIRVTHELGFAEVLRQPDEVIGTIRLRPWAKVSGRLLQADKPIPDQKITFSPIPNGKLGEPRFRDSYITNTDADGQFEFERLPPITGSIRALLGPWQNSPLTSSFSKPLDLKPGEERTITLGGKGIAVTGKVVATGRGDAELSRQWSLNYLISRDRGIELPAEASNLSFAPEDRVQKSRFLNPEYRDWIVTRENYFVKLTPDGQLLVHGVPPGTYDLVLQLYEQPAGCLVETVGEKVVTVEITESDQAAGTKDLGVIEVECRAGPRVGESMQLYSFTDPSGRQRTIQEMKGRYVLMHVWASWCAPCLENMPNLLATTEGLSDRPITFVGLNVDKDASRARAMAERGGWNWSQNYLGEASGVARQLAISTVPTYYLVGPDGLLVASSTDWSEIKDKLEDSLREISP